MKKYILLSFVAVLGLAACNQADRLDYGKEIVLVTGTDSSPISKDQVLADQIPIFYNFSVSATGPVTEDVKVHLQIDTLAVEEYNLLNKTSYASVPRNTVMLMDEYVTITKGMAVSAMTSVALLDNSFIQEGVNYVIPVSCAYVEGGKAEILPASKSLFIKLGKTMESYSLDIKNIGVYSTHALPNYELNNWTLEIKAHPYDLKSRGTDKLCRFCCWNEDGGGQVLLRFNENGKPWKTLDIVAPSGRYVTGATGEGDNEVGGFEPNQWYMISMVWDGANLTVYINGEKDTPWQNTVSGSQSFKLNRFEIGMSWGGYGSSQSYTGRMAEMRIWNVARSQSDIASTLCSVDAASAGLVGYWKMNEGEGHIFHDSVAGADMNWDNAVRQANESDYTNSGSGQYVQWVKDEKNKCAQ